MGTSYSSNRQVKALVLYAAISMMAASVIAAGAFAPWAWSRGGEMITAFTPSMFIRNSLGALPLCGCYMLFAALIVSIYATWILLNEKAAPGLYGLFCSGGACVLSLMLWGYLLGHPHIDHPGVGVFLLILGNFTALTCLYFCRYIRHRITSRAYAHGVSLPAGIAEQ